MRCIVPSCAHDSRQSSKSENITFHLLPTEPSRRAAWLKALGEVNWRSTDRIAGVCSCHFLPEDMYVSRGRRRLRPGAVPLKQDKQEKQDDSQIESSCPLQDTELSSKSRDLKACRICLATDCKLYLMSKYRSLEHAYATLTGLPTQDARCLPPWLCVECAQRLLNCVRFRARCLRARKVLADLTQLHSRITTNTLQSINRNRLRSNLGTVHHRAGHCDVAIEHIEREAPLLDEIKTECSPSVEDAPSSPLEADVDLVKTEPVTIGNGTAFGDGEEDQLGVAGEHVWDVNGGSAGFEGGSQEAARSPLSGERVGHKWTEDPDASESWQSRKRKASEEALGVAGEESGNTIGKRRRARKAKTDDGGAGEEGGEVVAEGEELAVLEERHLRLSRRLRDSLDRSVFTVSCLSLQQQVRERLERQRQPAYTQARYRCTVCFRGFGVQHCYEAHLVKHHELSGPYECVVCLVRARSAVALRKHVTAAHTRQYSCKICPFVSRHKGAAKQHQNFHAGIIYQCPHCPMSSNNYTTYQNHVRIKHATRHVCALCGYTFASEKGLHMHKLIKHRIGDALVVEGPHCAACDVRFISQLAYERHLRLSSRHCRDDDPERLSNDPQKMWADERRSTTLRQTGRRAAIRERAPPTPTGPVVCEQCGAELLSRRAYAHHFRFEHPGKNRTQFPPDKSYCMCELCGHVFHCNALLRGHMWLRHGVGDWRPQRAPRRAAPRDPPSYECPICAKRFTVKYNFQRHLFNHTGQRPHKCEECAKSFKSRAEKRSHVEHVHLKKPWPKRVRPRRTRRARGQAAALDDDDASVYLEEIDSAGNHEEVLCSDETDDETTWREHLDVS